MRTRKKTAGKPPSSRRILVLDVGGTHIKFQIDTGGKEQKFASGPKMTPVRMARQIRRVLRPTAYDAVSVGYPGLVFHGRITAEPWNLGHGWVGFDFGRALGRPVKVINDAAMQAIGSYAGGRMLFLGLGTGLGSTLIIDNVVEPMEIGHMPYKHGLTFEDYVGERGRKRRGKKKWRKAVNEVVEHLRVALEADYVVLGGGNALRLKKLPPHARLGDNRNAIVGGLRMWQQDGPRLMLPPGSARART